MNQFITNDLRSLHQSTWTEIRDEEPLPCQTHTTQVQSESKTVIGEIVKRITTAYEIKDFAEVSP